MRLLSVRGVRAAVAAARCSATHHRSSHRLFSAAAAASTSYDPASTCLVFPGQGSHRLGMGSSILHDYPTIAHQVWQQVNLGAGYDLRKKLYDSQTDSDLLRRTDFAQPAIYGVCMSTLYALLSELGYMDDGVTNLASLCMGHSLGECMALHPAGALSLSDTSKLLAARGSAMYAACPPPRGCMAAFIPCTSTVAKRICDIVHQHMQHKVVCTVANINTHNQVVISGDRAAVERAVVVAKSGDHAVRVAKLLDVDTPFHCSLLKDAQAPFANVLKTLTWQPWSSAWLSAVDCSVMTPDSNSFDVVRQLLVQQITAPVRWNDAVVAALTQGYRHFIEIGPSRVLSPMIDQIAKHNNVSGVTMAAITDTDTLRQYVELRAKG